MRMGKYDCPELSNLRIFVSNTNLTNGTNWHAKSMLHADGEFFYCPELSNLRFFFASTNLTNGTNWHAKSMLHADGRIILLSSGCRLCLILNANRCFLVFYL